MEFFQTEAQNAEHNDKMIKYKNSKKIWIFIEA
jgi:hypothetical protein